MTTTEQVQQRVIREQRHPAAWWLTAVLGASSIGLINHIVYTVCAIVLAIMAARAYAYSPQALKNFRIIALATCVFMALRVVLPFWRAETTHHSLFLTAGPPNRPLTS